MPSFLDATGLRGNAVRSIPHLWHVTLLFIGFFVLVSVPTSLIWGIAGFAAGAILVAVVGALAIRVPPEAVMRLYQATRLSPDESQLSSLVDVLAFRADLPHRPDLYVVPSATVNAFTAGSRAHAAIAVTEGLLRRLSLAETAGVIAHEMAHIRNNDLPVMGLADVMTRVLQLATYVALGLALYNVLAFVRGDDMVSWWAVVGFYAAPALFNLLQLQLSRDREFDADRAAVALSGDAAAFASALKHFDCDTGHFWEDLMLPVPGRRVSLPSMLRAHPPAEDRIHRFEALNVALERQHDPLVIVEQPMFSLVGYGPGDMRPRYRWPGLWF